MKSLEFDMFGICRLQLLFTCSMCLSGEESTEHLLLDCPKIHQVWVLLAEGNIKTGFFMEDLQTWLYSNLRNNQSITAWLQMESDLLGGRFVHLAFPISWWNPIRLLLSAF